MKKLMPLLLIGVGITLMIAQIATESEPGAIPLGLIVAGAAWLVYRGAKARRHRIEPL